MAYECDIEATAERDLFSNGPFARKIIEAGQRIRITHIYCHNGPYAGTTLDSRGRPLRSFCVPRAWLVECGALKPLSA